MPSVQPVRLWCLAIGRLMILSAVRNGSSTGHAVSTSPPRLTCLNFRSSGRTTCAPTDLAAAAIPLRSKHVRGSLQLMSVTMTVRAPASWQRRTTSATSCGLVFAACLLYTSDAADDLLCVDLG